MKGEIHINIAPSKKIATIKQGKKILKRYNFNTTIPFTLHNKEVDTYDYSNWCVSERSGTRTVQVKVFCSESINKLKKIILEYYINNK